MSRGPGRIERAIIDLIERRRRYKQAIAIDADDIAEVAYPRRRSTRAQRVAIHRAMHSIAGKVDGLVIDGGRGGQRLVILTGRGRGGVDYYERLLARRTARRP